MDDKTPELPCPIGFTSRKEDNFEKPDRILVISVLDNTTTVWVPKQCFC